MRVSKAYEYSVRNGACTVTLLLTRNQYHSFQASLRAFGMTRSVFFRNLLEEHSVRICRATPVAGPRTRYQASGQGLFRVNMKMDWDVWARLQAIARGLGVSACLLAAWLLEAHLKGAFRGGRMVSERNRSIRAHCFLSADMIRPIMLRRLTLRKYIKDKRLERDLRMVREAQRRWASGLPPDFSSEENLSGR